MKDMQVALLLVPLKGTLRPGYGCQFHLEFASTTEALEAPSLRCCPHPCLCVSRVEVIHPRDTQLGSQAKPAFQVTSALLLRETVNMCAESAEGKEGWGVGMTGAGHLWVYLHRALVRTGWCSQSPVPPLGHHICL